MVGRTVGGKDKNNGSSVICMQNAYLRLRFLSTQLVTLFGKIMTHLQGEASVSEFITEEKYWGCIV